MRKRATSFFDAQEQVTLWSLIRSGKISKSSKLWGFFHTLRGANSAGSSQIWPNFKQLPALMHVIITCKYEKDQIKTAEKSGNTIFSIITLSVAMETSSRIWPNFKLIQAFMYVIVTCKYEIDPIKNSQEKVATPFFPLHMSMGIFSDTQGQLTPQSVVQSAKRANHH